MNETTRVGFAAVIGAPNAGKSTLVNALVGQKVAIVSPKAQTTRARLMGIAIQDQTQVLLVDTPGIFAPRRRLDRAMVAAAWTGAEDADLILLVIDASEKVRDELLRGLEKREHRLFAEPSRGQLDDPVDGDARAVPPGAVLRRSVQHAARLEAPAGRTRRSRV